MVEPPSRPPCQVIDVDGEPIRVQNRGLPLTEGDLTAIREFKQLLRDRHAAEQQGTGG